SVDDLTERLECTKRTVQRDLTVLQDIGFPVSFEERDYGKRFWKLAYGFIESEKLALSVTEMLSLFLSQQLLVPLAGTQFGDGLATALQKVKALLPGNALEYFSGLGETILVKNSVTQDYSACDKQIRILNEAVTNQRIVKLVYRSASENRELNTRFAPYGMVLLSNILYCIGYLDEHREIRTLKVSRITEIEQTETEFEKPATFSLAAYTQGAFGIFSSDQYETVRAFFADWAAMNVREQQWHPSQKLVEDAGDTIVAEFELTSTVEFKRWILGFGRLAKVLKPRKLAKEVAEELEAGAAIYRE
ncbi:MAG: WYL domain-containing transcriptional regulator, partial [Planctomycetota bacterium]|nr:WYL domain-containing transcriptional regulator [Planctomycetota bacterium]